MSRKYQEAKGCFSIVAQMLIKVPSYIKEAGGSPHLPWSQRPHRAHCPRGSEAQSLKSGPPLVTHMQGTFPVARSFCSFDLHPHLVWTG